MAATIQAYGKYTTHLEAGDIDWAGDTIKLSLHTSSYALARNTDEFFDVLTNEITGTGYTAGGITLTTTSVSYASGTREEGLFADNVAVSALTPSAAFRYGVVYKDTGTASTSPLIAVINFGADQNPAGGPFGIVWASTGVLYIQAS